MGSRKFSLNSQKKKVSNRVSGSLVVAASKMSDVVASRASNKVRRSGRAAGGTLMLSGPYGSGGGGLYIFSKVSMLQMQEYDGDGSGKPAGWKVWSANLRSQKFAAV